MEAGAAAAALGAAAANGADAKIRAKRPSSSMSGVLSSFAFPYLLLPLSAPTYAGNCSRVRELLEMRASEHANKRRTSKNEVFPVTLPVTRPPWRLMSASASSLHRALH